jgi:hypothetical protein
LSDYLTAVLGSNLPLRWEVVTAIGLLLSVVGHALSKRAWDSFRAQSYISRDEGEDSVQRWGWVLPLSQFVYAAAIFLIGLYAGGPLFTLLVGGVLIALVYTAAYNVRAIVYYKSLSRSGAARGTLWMSKAMLLRQAVYSYIQAALFCFVVGLIVGHLALIGSGLILGLVALEYRKRMHRAEAHL